MLTKTQPTGNHLNEKSVLREISNESVARKLFNSDKDDHQNKHLKERMTFRKNKKKFMIYPEDKLKNFWDPLMTIILLIACITTPIELAFEIDSENTTDSILSYFIDLMFMIDIILIFFTAFYDEEMETVTDRKTIAKTYLKGWFILDLLAVIPF